MTEERFNELSLYSYLNLESTKTYEVSSFEVPKLYSYLNLESTKTLAEIRRGQLWVVQLLKS